MRALSCQTPVARKGRTRKGLSMVRLHAALLVLTASLGACSAPRILPPGEAVIYVIQRGWHTDIGLPVEEIAGPLATMEASFPGVRFLTFGFGERQFLLERTTNVWTMLGALLPSRSALLMTALSATPAQAFGSANVTVLQISRAGLDQMETAIWQEFDLSTSQQPTMLADGPYPGSTFYAARHTYYGLYTCNTWTADMLRAGGLPMPSAGSLFAGQVMGMATWIEAHQGGNPR
jgi:uncharacterized protein (TIGR02117 family)